MSNRIVKTEIEFCLACPHRAKRYNVCYAVDPPRDIPDYEYVKFPEWCPWEEVSESCQKPEIQERSDEEGAKIILTAFHGLLRSEPDEYIPPKDRLDRLIIPCPYEALIEGLPPAEGVFRQTGRIEEGAAEWAIVEFRRFGG